MTDTSADLQPESESEGDTSLAPDADPDEWVRYSDRDMRRAEVMLREADWDAVWFFCQQAVEKRIKAVMAYKTGQAPPKIHDLPDLAHRADLCVDEPTLDLLLDLTERYIAGRYPGTGPVASDDESRELAESHLAKSWEVIAWLDQVLTPSESPEEP